MKNKAVIAILWCMMCSAQDPYPKALFTAPLSIPILLSGTFGELRSNHFHSGIDIKTQQREGLAVYAIGSGYISRIKIAHKGFGKVLYITHPEGYTSVYAHLQKFSPDIEAYIKALQYEKETYEIQCFPKRNELPLQKQQLIGYTGNTGSSEGPHLHFEIREQKSQKPINPMLFGLPVKDTKPPSINGLYAYSLTDNTQINGCENVLQLYIKQQKDNMFLADTLYAEGIIGFGVDVHDSQDLINNKNGIYQLEMIVDNTVQLSYDFDTFSFSETKEINTFIDYEHYAVSKQRIQQCFVRPYNTLSIYNKKINNGYLRIKDSLLYTVVIRVKDMKGNTRSVKIPVVGKKQPVRYPKEEQITDTYLKFNRENKYDLGMLKLHFPAHTFYHDFYIDLKDNKDGTYTVHNTKVPVRTYFILKFDTSDYSIEERKKLFIAKVNTTDKDTIFIPTEKYDTIFTARAKTLGTYMLVSDDEPPVIRPKNFKNKQWLSRYSQLVLTIKDHSSGIKEYRATINGKWILMEYEPKTDTLTYYFEDKTVEKETTYNLEVAVTDNVGNRTIFMATFYRKI